MSSISKIVIAPCTLVAAVKVQSDLAALHQQAAAALHQQAAVAMENAFGGFPDLSTCQDREICDPIPGAPCFCDNVAQALRDNPDQTCESIDSPLLNPNIPASEFIISCPQACGVCEGDAWPCADYDAALCGGIEQSGLSCAQFNELAGGDANDLVYYETVCGDTCGLCEAAPVSWCANEQFAGVPGIDDWCKENCDGQSAACQNTCEPCSDSAAVKAVNGTKHH